MVKKQKSDDRLSALLELLRKERNIAIAQVIDLVVTQLYLCSVALATDVASHTPGINAEYVDELCRRRNVIEPWRRIHAT